MVRTFFQKKNLKNSGPLLKKLYSFHFKRLQHGHTNPLEETRPPTFSEEKSDELNSTDGLPYVSYWFHVLVYLIMPLTINDTYNNTI